MNQQQLKQQLIAWRHYLHAHPESAFEEQNTSRFIAEKLHPGFANIAVHLNAHSFELFGNKP